MKNCPEQLDTRGFYKNNIFPVTELPNFKCKINQTAVSGSAWIKLVHYFDYLSNSTTFD